MTRDFAFVLVPRFSLLALASAVDALRGANWVSGETLYHWRLLSEDGAPVASSSGIELACERVDAVATVSHAVVCGGERSQDWAPAPVLRWLHRQAARGACLGSLSDGAFVIAAAGLWGGARSTIHWLCLDAYRERYPDLRVRASVFEIDGPRCSCAGGTSALDLVVTLIAEHHGGGLAAAVADDYLHDRLRESGSDQHAVAHTDLSRRSRPLAVAVRYMTANLEQPLRLAAIAQRAGLSTRALQRSFRRHLGVSPAAYYRRLRLQRAERLLDQTALPITAIAAATGFASAAHLASRFRAAYDVSPRDYRWGRR